MARELGLDPALARSVHRIARMELERVAGSDEFYHEYANVHARLLEALSVQDGPMAAAAFVSWVENVMVFEGPDRAEDFHLLLALVRPLPKSVTGLSDREHALLVRLSESAQKAHDAIESRLAEHKDSAWDVAIPSHHWSDASFQRGWIGNLCHLNAVAQLLQSELANATEREREAILSWLRARYLPGCRERLPGEAL